MSSSSSPSIPNLLSTLRSTRPARSPRNNPLKRHDEPPAPSPSHQDLIVQQTDSDAAGSRVSAVSAGYLSDEFASVMWEGSGAGSHALPPRRMPIINRGTYVRTTALDGHVDEFLAKHAGADVVQIVSLGAGTDTRFFRVMKKRPEMRGRLRYHEVDFGVTTERKIRVIERGEGLMDVLVGMDVDATGFMGDRDTVKQAKDGGEDNDSDTITETPEQQLHTLPSSGNPSLSISEDKISLTSPSYFIHALDLRSLASPNAPSISHLDPHAPTLVLSECCLTYLSAPLSTAVLRHVVQTFISPSTPLTVLLYEPLHPTDAFGRTMLSNLASRSIAMPGLEAFPTLEAHGKRLMDVGFEAWEGFTVKEIWDRQVGTSEKERLRRVEMIDEEEEWILLAGHYGIIKSWMND